MGLTEGRQCRNRTESTEVNVRVRAQVGFGKTSGQCRGAGQPMPKSKDGPLPLTVHRSELRYGSKPSTHVLKLSVSHKESQRRSFPTLDISDFLGSKNAGSNRDKTVA